MAVTTINSGAEALKVMRSAATRGEPFAVALLDQHMPGMDGIELTHAIGMEPTITARLVLMTGLGLIDNLERVDNCGIFASVSKPIHREDLHGCLRVALGLLVADVASAEVKVPWSSSSGAPQAGWLLLAEDNLINQKVAVAMLTSAGYRVDTALNGAAAVAAAAANDYDAILMDCQMPELNGYEATHHRHDRGGSSRRS
jgi:CheY-like chemotaxis protein